MLAPNQIVLKRSVIKKVKSDITTSHKYLNTKIVCDLEQIVKPRRELRMLGLSGSEWLFYGGIAVMAAAGVLGMLSVIVFTLTGRALRDRLEQEYGKIRGKKTCPKE